MKNAVTPLLLISMLFSVTLSVAMMNHTDEMGHSLCPFEVAGLAECAQVQNTVDSLTSHLSALSKFFSTTPAGGFANLISLFLLLALAIVVTYSNRDPYKLKPLLIENQFRESFIAPNRILFNSWFSLHENSPAFIEG